MIVCELCNKNVATVHLTEIVDHNVKKELHLCDSCAKEKGVTAKLHQFSLIDIMGGLVEQQGQNKVTQTKCPTCGLSFNEFKAKTRFGCPKDYEVLRAAVIPLLEKIHGSFQYVGRTPVGAPAEDVDRNEVTELMKSLEKAVSEEDFETAARLRDRIKMLIEKKKE
jgi:protein arginine kinase activator